MWKNCEKIVGYIVEEISKKKLSIVEKFVKILLQKFPEKIVKFPQFFPLCFHNFFWNFSSIFSQYIPQFFQNIFQFFFHNLLRKFCNFFTFFPLSFPKYFRDFFKNCSKFFLQYFNKVFPYFFFIFYNFFLSLPFDLKIDEISLFNESRITHHIMPFYQKWVNYPYTENHW